MHAQRHTQLPCAAGRDSPNFRSDSLGHSSTGHLGQSQASGPVSQYSGPGTSQNGVRGFQEDEQAEDLVSDVHLRAQSASQAAVVAGQEQQQKVIAPALSLCICHKEGYMYLHGIVPVVSAWHCASVYKQCIVLLLLHYMLVPDGSEALGARHACLVR